MMTQIRRYGLNAELHFILGRIQVKTYHDSQWL